MTVSELNLIDLLLYNSAGVLNVQAIDIWGQIIHHRCPPCVHTMFSGILWHKL